MSQSNLTLDVVATRKDSNEPGSAQKKPGEVAEAGASSQSSSVKSHDLSARGGTKKKMRKRKKSVLMNNPKRASASGQRLTSAVSKDTTSTQNKDLRDDKS